MSAISALKSRHRRQALAAQKAAEPALHIIQHAHCAEPTEICPKCSGRGSCDKSRNGNLEYGTCDKCGGSGKLLPC
jgi:hypothetical protein